VGVVERTAAEYLGKRSNHCAGGGDEDKDARYNCAAAALWDVRERLNAIRERVENNSLGVDARILLVIQY
jgi:hypothetical protein